MAQVQRMIRLFVVFALVMGGAGLVSAAEMMEEKPMQSDKPMQTDPAMQSEKAMQTDKAMKSEKAMQSEKAMNSEKTMQGEKAMQGMLSGSKDHHASGKIAWNKNMKGHTTLTLSDIKIDKVPDGYVYLAKGGDWRKGVELGRLKKFTGTVSFDLPMGVHAADYDSVVIWCKKFKVEIGQGTLPGTMMK